MNFHPRILLPFVLTALCRAQTPAAPAHSHAPPASSHETVVVLDQYVTSATPFPSNQVDLAQSTTVLSGQLLRLKQLPTLGDTLAAETGIQATAFGPGASRPIIRGLGGDRIRLLENSVGTLDASVVSPDHAVTVEPLLIERIEIVRGPASLLYGSNAVGGVVNVITHRIETDMPATALKGGAEVRGGTAADEVAGGGTVDIALKSTPERAIVLHLDGFRRRTENLRIPGFAESATVRMEETGHAEEHGEEPPVFAHRRLPNSALDTRSGAAGLSYVTLAFHFGISHSGVDSDYGVPGHAHLEEDHPALAEGVRIDLRQRRTDVQGEWHAGEGIVRGVRMKFGQARYRHSEIEPDGVVGTVFTNRGHEGRLELLHGDAPWAGAVGAQITRSDFGAAGEEAFLPNSLAESVAVFAFEEVNAGPVAWQFGARYERATIAPERASSRRDAEIAGSLGAVWKLHTGDVIAFALSQTGRAPNVQELYAYGPHAGTNSFEVGDAALRSERSQGIEASFRRRKGFITGALTVFANRFEDYIFEQPVGLLSVEREGEWVFVSPGADELESEEEALPVYRYVQDDANFWGAEIETIWHLHKGTKWNLDVRLAADFTRARASGRNLPRIPAARTTAGISWINGRWSAGTECQIVFRQSRLAVNESASDGYTLLSAYVSREIQLGRTSCDVFLRGTNLLNEEARPHTSVVKNLAPQAARAATAGVRLQF